MTCTEERQLDWAQVSFVIIQLDREPLGHLYGRRCRSAAIYGGRGA